MLRNWASFVALNRALLERSARLFSRPYHVMICGKEMIVRPGVFSPAYADGTEFFTEVLPYRQGETFLEIGCGIGVAAVSAACRGASRVVAVDINPMAVKNTRQNARKHSVSGVVTTRVSDIYSQVPKLSYDTIFWNTPFLEVPSSYRYRSMLERSVFDPGYELNARFLRGAPERLSPNGRVLIGFGSLGSMDRLRANVKKAGFASCHQIATRMSSIEAGPGGKHLRFILLELRRA